MPGTTRRGGLLSRRGACARLVALSWTLAACRQDTRPAQLRGLVVDVRIATFTQIQGFSLRTDDGSVYELIVEGDVGISPGHLREHMLLGEPVIVTVRYADDLQIATRVDDAEAAP
ncbi:MAG: hypothetical protein IT306_01050 [Chloroflexi bacterium]|nr:hypothetical protein [Chloroflexota bacterium]